MIPYHTAISFAKHNFKVFPLKNNTKSGQILKSWKNEATIDEGIIESWFMNHDYNLGICTGNGLVVIDIDYKKSDKGLKKLKEVRKMFPATYMVSTPSNGFHLYYLVDRPIKSSVGLYEEIDVRGEGAYIVGAGSEINGHEYSVTFDRPIARANQAVYDFLEGDHTSPKKVEISSCINIGQRNDYLFKLGCSLQQKGLSDESINTVLEIENQEKCNPPLDDREVKRIIKSVIRYDKPTITSEEYKKTWESAAVKKNKPKKENTDIVKGMIPIGVTIIAAPPKMGKTFFCMDMCNSIALGIPFLEHETKQSNTYYLALEDPDENQTDRLQNNFDEVAENYDIETLQAYDPGFNLEDKIINYMHFNPYLKVVVVDTFEKTRDITKDRKYAIEYKEVSYYHELAIKYNIAIVLVMHTIKNINYNAPFTNISGSAGVQAAADSMLILLDCLGNPDIKALFIDGKSILKDEIYLRKNEKCRYMVIQHKDNTPSIDPDLQAIINYVIASGSYSGPAEKLGVNAKTTNTNGVHIRNLLDRNVEVLKAYFISYTKQNRTTASRRFELRYYGEDPINDSL